MALYMCKSSPSTSTGPGMALADFQVGPDAPYEGYVSLDPLNDPKSFTFRIKGYAT